MLTTGDSLIPSRRRARQMAAAQWLAKWTYRLQALFASIGFFLVLLPVLNNQWREVIEAFALTAWIFRVFSTLTGGALILLGILMLLFLILNFMVKDYPGGWNPTKEWGFPSPKQVVERELYPRNRKEEFVFWIDIIFGIVGTTFWLYLPFGVLAYFIRIGA
ncbi:hypothetical protein [Sideroxyarcus sp. TK5]